MSVAFVHMQAKNGFQYLCQYGRFSKIQSHIVSYFYKEVTYYSYILLNQKNNFVISLMLSKVMILCNLVTTGVVTELPLKFTYEHVCEHFLFRVL